MYDIDNSPTILDEIWNDYINNEDNDFNIDENDKKIKYTQSYELIGKNYN